MARILFAQFSLHKWVGGISAYQNEEKAVMANPIARFSGNSCVSKEG
jgi:hypothetical protein